MIGPNGAGKTTLLRLISGEIDQDSGTVSTGNLRIGYLKQETQEEDTGLTVLEQALTAFSEVQTLEKEEEDLLLELEVHPDPEDADHDRLLIRLDEVHGRMAALESHRAKSRAESILTGLGFAAEDQLRPVSTFSGGWRMRVALAHLLLCSPDILLLDEPTNHLDIDSIDWLEAYLKSFAGSVVIVSHDRYFLDRMVTGIVEMSQGNLTEYAGNYTFYLMDRVERRAVYRASYINQQKYIEETKRFIERFRAKATKARQVQSRIKMLDSLERLPPPPADDATITFRFQDPPRASRVLLEIPQFSKTYSSEDRDIEVFQRTGPLKIERGDRIALIGPNGAGKSTLARILLGTEPFDGQLQKGQKMELSYFAQNQAESLPQNRTVFEVVREAAVDRTETWIRTLLGAFLFHGDDVFKSVSVLSGGERSRVALARTLISPANFLILDEPTNHLDIQSRNVLIEALRQYSGTFVLVSHDRHFLDQTVSKIWRVGNKQVQEFHGNYSDYVWQTTHGTASRIAGGSHSGPGRSNGSGLREKDKNAATAGDGRGAVKTAGDGQRGAIKTAGDGQRSAIKTAVKAASLSQNAEQRGPKSKEQKREEAREREKKRKARKSRSGSRYGSLNDYQLKKDYDKTEASILQKESERSELESALADPKVFKDGHRSQKLLADLEKIQKKIAADYERWEHLTEEMTARIE